MFKGEKGGWEGGGGGGGVGEKGGGLRGSCLSHSEFFISKNSCATGTLVAARK